MKRLMSTILIICLLLPTSTLQLIAETTVSDEEEGQIVLPTTYFSFDGDLTDQTDSQKIGTAWTRYEEGISDWGEQPAYTFTYADDGVNQSLRFDGTTGVKLPDNLLTSAKYSYSFWLKQTGDISEFTSAFYAGIGLSRTGISPAISGNGEVIYQVADNDATLRPGYTFQSLPEYHHEQWNHFFVTADTGSVTIYLNGEAIGTMTDVPDLFTNRDNEFLLGFNPFPDAYYQGLMDELMFFDNVVVNETMVQQYYAANAVVFGHENEQEPVDPPDGPSETPDGNPEHDVITNDEIPALPVKESTPTFSNVSVHDPSIVIDDDTYYIFGSHLASAKSTDLIRWEQMTTEVSNDNPLFQDVFEELKEVFDWSESDTLWAADVIQLIDGRYYMYYNACRGDSPLSAMGLAVSDTIEGPYEDLGLFLWSGKNPNPMEINYNIDIHPNAVDPAVFFDKEGQLWMVYGSYSGGIFILELDNDTGLPKESGYGKKLMGGGVRIEAPYMQYIEETDYYYLYTTFGGLSADGGYNMRISRSKNPDGPFVDISGQDMIDAKGREGIPFDDEAIEPFGNKLNGNFVLSNLNETDDFPVYGYVSPGHNSAFVDETTGEHFAVFHTRFPNRGEEHEVRVHLMPMNKEGWPVMAPLRYSGERLQPMEASQVSGTYHFVNHGDQISAEVSSTQYIELNKDGTITGEVSGTWTLSDDYDVTIVIDDVTYQGVVLMQYSPVEERYVPTFTALSNHGHSIWGIGFEAVTDEVFIDQLSNNLKVNVTDVYRNLDLKTTSVRGATITWSSSNDTYLSTTGHVTRPTEAEGDQAVTLTATIHYNGLSETKTFDVNVKAKQTDITEDGLVAHYPFDQTMTDLITHDLSTVTGEKMDHQTDDTLNFAAGAIGDAIELDGAHGVLLRDDLIQSYDYTVSLWLKPDVLTNFSPGFFGTVTATRWTNLLPASHDGTTMLWSGTHWYDASIGETITQNEWTHLAYTVHNGHVVIYVNGHVMFEGNNFPDVYTNQSAQFSLGVNLWDTPFKGLIDDVRIYGYAHGKEMIQALMEVESDDQTKVSSLELSATDKRLVKGQTETLKVKVYPLNAGNRALTYTSSDQNVVSVNDQGVITAVDFGEATVTVQPVASPTISETVTVKVTDGKVAHFSFNETLADTLGIQQAGTVTGDRLTNTNGDITYAEARFDQGVVFDGQSGVRLPNGLIQSPTYSVALWLHPDEITPFTTTFFGATSDSKWLSLVPSGPGNGHTALWSGSNQWFDGLTDRVIPANEWTHVSFTVDEGDVVVYLNGDPVFNGSGLQDVFTTDDAAFGLGVNYWDVPYKGMMDELIVYDGYSLTQEDVKAIYTRNNSGQTPDEGEEAEDNATPGEDEEAEDNATPGEDEEPDDNATPGEGEEPEDDETPEDESSDDGDDEVSTIVDTMDAFDEVTTEADVTTYHLQFNQKAIQFTSDLLAQLEVSGQIELIRDGITLVIPVRAIYSENDVNLSIVDITETAISLIDQEAYRVMSPFIDFALTADNQKIDFSDVGIKIKLKVNPDSESDWNNLDILYIDHNNNVITDHGAEIVFINETTGEITMNVTHFSTYGLVERLGSSNNDVTTPDSSEEEVMDGEIDRPDDSDENDVSQENESDQGTGSMTEVESDETPTLDEEMQDSDLEAEKSNDDTLPNTATNLYLFMYLGLWLMLLAGGLLAYRRQIR